MPGTRSERRNPLAGIRGENIKMDDGTRLARSMRCHGHVFGAVS